MGEHRDEFELSSDMTLFDVKSKVSQWHGSQLGKDYVLSVKAENHIVLTKSKLNMNICWCTGVFAAIGVFSIGGLYFPPGTTVYEILQVLSIYAVVIITGIIVGITLLCGFQTRVEYSFTFHDGSPIHVSVYGKGAIDKTIQEYLSLRNTLNWKGSHPSDGHSRRGPDL